MRIITDGEVRELPIRILHYRSFWKRFRGLMFRFQPIENEGILIEPCNSVHMFFMFFPIDIALLNDRNEIVFIKEGLKPWTAVFPVKHARAALELPVGTVSRYGFGIGDQVEV